MYPLNFVIPSEFGVGTHLMTQPYLASSALTTNSPSPALRFTKSYWLPLLSFAILCLAVSLTPNKDSHIHYQTKPELLAHALGHWVNSVWVGIGLILLIIPSLIATYRYQKPDQWAWRAVDAIFLDFLSVDALGKNLLTSLGRPGHPDQPGFPSGHATMAFLMASLIWRRYPNLGPLWFFMATIISWSRIESHAHFPYQVIAGALYGCVLSTLIMRRQSGVLLPRVLLSDSILLKRLSVKNAEQI
jgi:membrane-associated phospholipid phosphatase